ncbi:MAG: ubiquinone/menaquinone biosynthesis methyltransferase [Candidatus Zixiibacteriota bacterium]|nr:MAG: ubiquinone/menaquinone biosynthesis methyltransferase [candidate division Zixibacteria bacterium]
MAAIKGDKTIINGKDFNNRPLYRMFSNVPHRYDFLNRILTLGLDQRWRKKAAAVCLESNPGRIMDLCSGTGDLAIELSKNAKPGTEIIAADFCEPMLEMAKHKASRLGFDDRITFQIADAASLPFDDGYFDVVGIAFGFRNLTFKNRRSELYLKEICRVIAPGGRLVIVETSQPKSVILKKLSGIYYSSVVKPAGNVISGQPGAYSYLAHSAKNYFKPSDIENMLKHIGFMSVDYRPLWRGIAGIHVAKK